MKQLLYIVLPLSFLLPARSIAQEFTHTWLDVSRNPDPAAWDCALPNSGSFPIHIIARPNQALNPGFVGFISLEFGVDLSDLLAQGAGYIASEVSHGSFTNGSISPGPGVQVAFLECQESDVLVYTIYVNLAQPIIGTAYVSVTESSFITHVLKAEDCTPLRAPRHAIGGQGIASSEGTTCSIAAQNTTWGKIKELYQ